MQTACRIFIFRQAVLCYDKVIFENNGIKQSDNTIRENTKSYESMGKRSRKRGIRKKP